MAEIGVRLRAQLKQIDGRVIFWGSVATVAAVATAVTVSIYMNGPSSDDRRRLKRMKDPIKKSIVQKVRQSTIYNVGQLGAMYDGFTAHAVAAKGQSIPKMRKPGFVKLLKSIGFVDQPVVDSICRAWGIVSEDSTISFAQFMSTLQKATDGSSESKYAFIFDTFDLNSDGYLSIDEFKAVFLAGEVASRGEGSKSDTEPAGQWIQEATKRAMDRAQLTHGHLKSAGGFVTKRDFLDNFGLRRSSDKSPLSDLGITISDLMFEELGMQMLKSSMRKRARPGKSKQ